MEPTVNPMPQFTENSYKMTDGDVKRLIELRASNEALFTGKRNSAKIAWSSILKGLGLEGKLTTDQIAKKWDNLRSKYMDLKQPYQGQDHIGPVVESWPWFHIMDEAMQGRLYNSSLVLSPEVPTINCSPRGHSQPNQSQDSTDILEFLIKTEMEDTMAAEATSNHRAGRLETPTTETIPMGWRRMRECSYKMTEPETERMIKLRASNEALFTGRKNSAKPAWRAILYELGLQGKLTTDQLAKKWDNMKRRYKDLKFPSRGVETNPSSWPWFYRMNDAMEGRFSGAAPVLTPVVEDEDEDCEPLSPSPRKRPRLSRGGMSEFLTESEMDLLVDNEEKNGSASLGELHRMNEFIYKLTEDDTRRLIELRAANESLFTGRRNTAKPAWRGILKEMGLTGKITPDQVAKKWDNMKTKFKDLKFPPRGMEAQTNPASWPWFQLMSDALEGRLAGKAPQVAPIWTNEEDAILGSSPPDRDALMLDRNNVSEPEGDNGDNDGNVTYIDASGEECSTPSDFTYKMTDQDTRSLIKLRAANEPLFTGRRNAAKAAWRAILKELGLQGKISTYQMAKKWDNLKRRYKDLKYPPVGMESAAEGASTWSWFHLMNDAMEGRLASSGPLLTPITQDDDQHPGSTPRHRPRPTPLPPPSSSSDYVQEAFGGGEDDGAAQDQRGPEACNGSMGGLEREWEMVERERVLVEREREMVERERAAVERERAAVQAERLWLERERAAVERDRTLVEQERAALDQRALMLNSMGHSGHLNTLM